MFTHINECISLCSIKPLAPLKKPPERDEILQERILKSEYSLDFPKIY